MKKLRKKIRDILYRRALRLSLEKILSERAKGSQTKPRLLVVDRCVPEWDRDAGSRSTLDILKMFVSRGFQVIFWPDDLNETPVYTKYLQEIGIEVICGPRHWGHFDDWISINGRYVDYVILNKPFIAIKYIDAVRRNSRAKLLYYGHDLHWKRLERERAISGDDDMDEKILHFKALEQKVISLCDVVMYPSQEECDLVRAEVGSGKSVIEIPVWCFAKSEITTVNSELDRRHQYKDPLHLLFVGGFAHSPNVDAMLWFASEVLPKLRSENPGFRLTIAGSNPPQRIRDLAGPTVEVTGFIHEDRLDKLYQETGASVVPLRFGAGVKGKVIEAFVKGQPVISTSVGMQGISGCDNIAFLGDSAGEIVEQIMFAVANRKLVLEKARRALEYVNENYSVETLVRRLAPEVPELVSEGMVAQTGVDESSARVESHQATS
jgi:glycosyltransferase involved in cell wall biosynthesis